MSRDRWVAVFVVLTAIAVAVVVVSLTFFRPGHERVVEQPIIAPPQTPLRDSIRETKRSERSKGSTTKKRGGAAGELPSTAKPKVGSSPSSTPTQRKVAKKRSPAKKPKATASPSKPSASPQPSSTPPQNTTPTQPTVSVPLPSVCTDAIRVNC